MKNLIIFLAAASLGGFFMPVKAEEPRAKPPGMYSQTVPMLVHCFDQSSGGFIRMMEVLARDFDEQPVMVAHMTPETSLIYFSNPTFTSSTLVVSRKKKSREETCILWAGKSELNPETGKGNSFLLSPTVDLPETVDGEEL